MVMVRLALAAATGAPHWKQFDQLGGRLVGSGHAAAEPADAGDGERREQIEVDPLDGNARAEAALASSRCSRSGWSRLPNPSVVLEIPYRSAPSCESLLLLAGPGESGFLGALSGRRRVTAAAMSRKTPRAITSRPRPPLCSHTAG